MKFNEVANTQPGEAASIVARMANAHDSLSTLNQRKNFHLRALASIATQIASLNTNIAWLENAFKNITARIALDALTVEIQEKLYTNLPLMDSSSDPLVQGATSVVQSILADSKVSPLIGFFADECLEQKQSSLLQWDDYDPPHIVVEQGNTEFGEIKDMALVRFLRDGSFYIGYFPPLPESTLIAQFRAEAINPNPNMYDNPDSGVLLFHVKPSLNPVAEPVVLLTNRRGGNNGVAHFSEDANFALIQPITEKLGALLATGDIVVAGQFAVQRIAPTAPKKAA